MPKRQAISDHDLLIRLDEKVDVLVLQIQTLNDGITERIGKLEVRMTAVEKVHDQVDPLGSKQQLEKVLDEVRDFKTSANTYRVIGGLIGATMFFILTQIPAWLKVIGIIK